MLELIPGKGEGAGLTLMIEIAMTELGLLHGFWRIF